MTVPLLTEEMIATLLKFLLIFDTQLVHTLYIDGCG